MMRERRLFAVDPSLTCSGWALFSIGEGSLLGVGKLRSLPPSVPLPSRLKHLQEKIGQIFDKIDLAYNDVLVCEGETSMRDPKAAFKVEQVRGMFETVARERKVSVPGRISPRSVQFEVIGLRGPQQKRILVKQAACNLVDTLYKADLERFGFEASVTSLARNQDIVDAILVGMLSLARLNMAIAAGNCEVEAFQQVSRSRRDMKRNSAAARQGGNSWSERAIKKILTNG